MFHGVSAEGIQREVSFTLKSAKLCRDHDQESLANPATALLHMAHHLKVPSNAFCGSRAGPGSVTVMPDCEKVCRGILPSLIDVVKEEKLMASQTGLDRASIPDSHEDPNSFPIDPFGRYECSCI